MTIKRILIGTVTAIGLIGFGTSAAYATTINFDQRDSGATGGISYDGAGGALVGNNISFSFVSSPGTAGSLDCSDCLLNFTTGNFASENDDVYRFNGGGSFELTGDVLEGGSTLASGSLISGEFTGSQTYVKADDTSGSFNGDGANSVNDALSAYFGIDEDSDFLFLTTNFSIGSLTFGEDGGFSGAVDAADLATKDVNSVPEPQELGIFGLGLALIVGSLLYRRKNGADIG